MGTCLRARCSRRGLHPPCALTAPPLPLLRPPPPAAPQFERFRRILYTPYYMTLLGCSSWEFTSSLEVSESVWVARVHVVNEYRREVRRCTHCLRLRRRARVGLPLLLLPLLPLPPPLLLQGGGSRRQRLQHRAAPLQHGPRWRCCCRSGPGAPFPVRTTPLPQLTCLPAHTTAVLRRSATISSQWSSGLADDTVGCLRWVLLRPARCWRALQVSAVTNIGIALLCRRCLVHEVAHG